MKEAYKEESMIIKEVTYLLVLFHRVERFLFIVKIPETLAA